MRLAVAFVLLCTSFAVVAARRITERDEVTQSMSEGVRAEVEANAEMVADINTAAEELRAERAADASGVKKFWCKTIKKTDPHNLSWVTKFMASKYGQWVPKTEKSISVYLQAEANAAAFVGVSGGVGVGIDFTLDTTGKTATGQIRVYACLSGSVTVGYIGAKVTGGAGLYIGFGKSFATSIGGATFEVGFDIPVGAAPVTVGLGILFRIDDVHKQGFIKGWNEYQKKNIADDAGKKAQYLAKAKNLAGRIVAGLGQELKAFCPNFRVVGLALHVGAGVGGGYKTEVAVDVEPLVGALKTGLQAVWKKFNFKTPAWLGKLTDSIQSLKAKISATNHKAADDYEDDTEATESGDAGAKSGAKPGAKPGGKPNGRKK